ncbi:glycoside hydrolase family 55 protein [Methylacidiphilum caldifontis]|uniref:Peptidase n=1 Tax=Methylacidiphilum caldifontis TaxID=2795386 RepID=A0A4Y8PF98_9BACT|nr:glycoside hydrolase family 55 protein [Methylacidiphilum caldifontis]TFE70702.1 peptidase [Methylacidiphilum caldifontis]
MLNLNKILILGFISFCCFYYSTFFVYARSSTFWVSEPVEPADGVIVYGWGFAPKEEIFLWALPDEDPKTGYVPFSFSKEKRVTVSPMQVTEQSIKFEIPAVFPPGIFGVEIAENQFLINRPRIEWCQPSRLLPGLKQDETYPGSELCIIGHNILLSPEDAQRVKVMVTAKKSNQSLFLEVIEVEKYCCRVKIPETLSTGEYDLLIHNGHGGQSGWSEPFLLRVVNPASWPSKILSIREYGAKGDGKSDDSEALRKVLKAAESNGGAIVYIPAGIYKVKGSFYIPPKTLLEGDGVDFSWLSWPENEPHGEEDFIPAAFVSSGQFALEELSISVRNAKRVLVDRSILKDEEVLGNAKDWEDLSSLFKGGPSAPTGSASDVFLRNIRIQFFPFYGYPQDGILNSPQWKILKWGLVRSPGLGFALALGSLANVEISGCEIIGCRQRAVHLKNGRITQNSFYNPMGAFCLTEIGGEKLFVEDNWFSDESAFYRRLSPLRYMYVAHNQFSEFGRGNRLALSCNLGFLMGKKKENTLTRHQPLKATAVGNELILKEGTFPKDSLVNQQLLIVEDNKEPIARKVIANNEHKVSIDSGASLSQDKELSVYLLPWSSPFVYSVVSSERAETKVSEKNLLPGLVGLDVLVVSGKGAGQLRQVTAQNANTISIDRPWDVAPDFSSLLLFYQWEGRSIFFENQGQDCRFLFPLSRFGYDVIFDGNQVKRSGGMIAEGGYFIQWINNILDVAVNYPAVRTEDPLDLRIKSLDFGALGFLIDKQMDSNKEAPFETIRAAVLRSNRLAFGHRIVVGVDHNGEGISTQAVVGKDLLIDHNWFEHGLNGIEIGEGIRQSIVMRNLYFDIKEPLRIKEKKDIFIKD